MNSEIKSIWTGAAVLALLVYAGAAFAQLPGGASARRTGTVCRWWSTSR